LKDGKEVNAVMLVYRKTVPCTCDSHTKWLGLGSGIQTSTVYETSGYEKVRVRHVSRFSLIRFSIVINSYMCVLYVCDYLYWIPPNTDYYCFFCEVKRN